MPSFMEEKNVILSSKKGGWAFEKFGALWLKVVQSTRALLRARCRLFSLVEKGLTPGSDYSEIQKQNQVLILKGQLTRKAG